MISVIIGTRPEIIKMAPVLRELQLRQLPFEFVHSNQHYSSDMDSVFLKELKLPDAAVNLRVGSGSHARQVADLLVKVEEYCLNRQPKLVMVHGDTNTTLGACMAAAKLNIPVAHVEAGLRSHDMTMPEEQNRIIVDHLADCLFAPTLQCQVNLLSENISKDKIHVTGNTIADAVMQHLPLTKSLQLSSIQPYAKNEYLLVTAHRPSNVDSVVQLKKLIHLLDEMYREFGKPIVWPIHPRAKQAIEKAKLKLGKHITLISPLGYLEMLRVLQDSWAIVTDSGGVQEEAYLLQKPLVTLRLNTERPETLTANHLVGLSVSKAKKALNQFLQGQASWPPTLGEGTAAQQIVTIAERYLS